MILLWGLDEDAPLRLLRDALHEIQAPFLFLDQTDLLNTHLEVHYSPAVTGVRGVGGTQYPVETIRAFYLRPYDFRDFPAFADLDRESPEWRHAAVLENILWCLADITDALVLNRPCCRQVKNLL